MALIHYATFVGFLNMKCDEAGALGRGSGSGSGGGFADYMCQHSFSSFLQDGVTLACCVVKSSRMGYISWFSSFGAAMATAWTATAAIIAYIWQVHPILEKTVTHKLWWNFVEQL